MVNNFKKQIIINHNNYNNNLKIIFKNINKNYNNKEN